MEANVHFNEFDHNLVSRQLLNYPPSLPIVEVMEAFSDRWLTTDTEASMTGSGHCVLLIFSFRVSLSEALACDRSEIK